MRKELKSFLAPSLADRVDFTVTSYRKAHDSFGHAEVLVDGAPVTNFCSIKKGMRACVRWDDESSRCIPAPDYDPHAADFGQWDFIVAAGFYLTRPVRESLDGVEDAPDHLHTATIRRCLALMDRRVGKRTLQRMAGQMTDAPEIVRFFYELRCEADGLRDPAAEPSASSSA
ncbi:MAG: hypothetical protein M1617_04025 [Actinobacteria bacterium]|nr:hypothetical protein [Actinomycetota bacterium]